MEECQRVRVLVDATALRSLPGRVVGAEKEDVRPGVVERPAVGRERCAYFRRHALVRGVDAALDREIAGDGPDDEEENEREDRDERPAPPRPAEPEPASAPRAIALARDLRGPWAWTRAAAPASRAPRRPVAAGERDLSLVSPPAVDPVRLLLGGAHPGHYGTQGGRPPRNRPRQACGARSLMPLAVCATPIGNLEDVTLRVLAELAAADVVLCEDTRHTRGLLQRHGIEARLVSLPRAQRGAADGGASAAARRRSSGSRSSRTPGCRASPIRARGSCVRRSRPGVEVTVLPGPSAVETALVASGLVGRAVPLPRLPAARREARSAELWAELAAWPWPAVAFESPQRLPATLRSLAAALPGARGCRLPRADEAVRGDRARAGRRACGAVRGAAEGRDHARARAGRAGGRRTTTAALEAVTELVAAGVPRQAGCGDRLAADRRRAQPSLQAVAVIRFDNVVDGSILLIMLLKLTTIVVAFSRLGSGRERVELARARAGAPAVLVRRGAPVRRWPAPRHRHRRDRDRRSRRRAREWDGELRRLRPTSGESLTIETADGYSVTLTHLGSIGVATGASVARATSSAPSGRAALRSSPFPTSISASA